MAKLVNPKDPIAFQITDITILESNLGPFNSPLPDDTVYTFKFEIDQRVDLLNSLVQMVVKINVLYNETDQILSSLRVGYSYKVDKIEQHSLSNGSLPDEKLEPMNNVSLSTTRGIFFSMARGTFLNKALMPIVPSSMFSSSKIATGKD